MEKKTSSTDYIYQKIRKGIIDGYWLPGERLITAKLASQFNVSRTPIREALKKLENDALVNIELNVGAVIRKVDLKEVKDIYELRAALESLAVEKIIQNGADPELIEQLRSLCQKRKDATSFDEFETSDREFHFLLCRASQSKVLLEVTENYMIIASSFTTTPRIMKSRKFNHGRKMLDHDKIVDAIEAGNTKKAVRLVKKHIATAYATLEVQYMEQAAQTV